MMSVHWSFQIGINEVFQFSFVIFFPTLHYEKHETWIFRANHKILATKLLVHVKPGNGKFTLLAFTSPLPLPARLPSSNATIWKIPHCTRGKIATLYFVCFNWIQNFLFANGMSITSVIQISEYRLFSLLAMISR